MNATPGCISKYKLLEPTNHKDLLEIDSQMDPLRDFNFWEAATVADVEREISCGGQYGAFPTSTVFGGFPSSHAYASREYFLPGQLRDFGGLTLLHWAIAGCCAIEVVEYLLSLGIDVNSKDRWDCGGATPLHFAAQLGMRDMADFLIQKGADIEASTDSGTPLHWAISGPDPRHVVFISDRYAQVLSCQADGVIGLSIPSGWRNDPVFASELFQQSPRKWIILDRDIVWIAPNPGRDLQTVQLLVERGADAAAVTPYGLSPLHLVSIPGCECDTGNKVQDPTCPLLALVLIDAGADINAVNEDEDSVLDLANCPRLKAELANRGAQQGYREEWTDDWDEDPDDC